MALNLIVLGPPGAGKGTQAEELARARGIPKISSGDMLRSAVKAGTEIGLRAKAIMERGELVNDDVMIRIVEERLAQPDVKAGFILDGFPRTVAQAIALDGIMTARDPLVVVDIAVAEDELVRRMLARVVCLKCGLNADAGTDRSAPCARCGGTLGTRADDNEVTVRERLRVYNRDTRPLVEFYQTRPTFRAIDGAQSAVQVSADLALAIDVLGAVAQGAHR